MKLGIVGVQHRHIYEFVEGLPAKGIELAGIYDNSDYFIAGELSEKYGVKRYGDKESLINDVDVVMTFDVNSSRIDNIELCSKLGKPIMTDKPPVVNRKDMERLKKVINEGRIQVGLMMTERFNSAVYTLKNMIDRGELGKVICITVDRPIKLMASRRPEWYFDKSKNGGIVIDMMVHDFDLARWITGSEIASFKGYIKKDILPEHKSFYNSASMNMLMENNIIYMTNVNWHMPEGGWVWTDRRMFCTGTKGRAEVVLAGDPDKGEGYVLFTEASGKCTKIENIPLPGDALDDFVNRIQGKPYIIGQEDVINDAEASLRADESAEVIVGV